MEWDAAEKHTPDWEVAGKQHLSVQLLACIKGVTAALVGKQREEIWKASPGSSGLCGFGAEEAGLADLGITSVRMESEGRVANG